VILLVKGCTYMDNGTVRTYSLSDASTVVELTNLPGKMRFRFFDPRNRTVFTNATKQAMKKAVDQHKARWRIS